MKAATSRLIKRKMEIIPRFHQADMMGVIHNVEYFHWFEEGRLQIMLEVLPMAEAMALGVAMPVVENYCRYKTPARFGDVLTLYTTHRVSSHYEGHLRFEHSLVNSRNKTEMACGYAVATLVDMATMQLIKEWTATLWDRYQSLR
ncbi:MAG: acyl-CoA thioesterase [bacterium]